MIVRLTASVSKVLSGEIFGPAFLARCAADVEDLRCVEFSCIGKGKKKKERISRVRKELLRRLGIEPRRYCYHWIPFADLSPTP